MTVQRPDRTLRNRVIFVLAMLVVLLVIVLVGIELLIPGPGLLRVTASPPVPTQILVDHQVTDSGGLNWLKMMPGSHIVCFTYVEGWTEPACQNVTITKGTTTLLTGEFVQRGTLRVITQPAVPSQILVDGNPTNDWSMWTDIPVGPHKVCFGLVRGYDPPACQDVIVDAGTLTTVTGKFKANRRARGQVGVGLLYVTTSPNVPSQILITPPTGQQYIADSASLDSLELPPGLYKVTFRHAPGYAEPPPEQVSIAPGATQMLTGVFTQLGTLTVNTSPAEPGTILVDGVARDDWSLSTEFPIGSHRVCFGDAAGYSKPPPCQVATVIGGAETTVIGTYS